LFDDGEDNQNDPEATNWKLEPKINHGLLLVIVHMQILGAGFPINSEQNFSLAWGNQYLKIFRSYVRPWW
jgi:hypothetical protein